LGDLFHDSLTFFSPVEVKGQEDYTAHQIWDGVEEFVLDGLVVGSGGGGLQGGIIIIAKGESGDNYR
jgi:cysteine synthase